LIASSLAIRGSRLLASRTCESTASSRAPSGPGGPGCWRFSLIQSGLEYVAIAPRFPDPISSTSSDHSRSWRRSGGAVGGASTAGASGEKRSFIASRIGSSR
jgi:hypothetical protein